eukprot:15325796-Ditylum_brightwellii.AAC.1
MSVSSPPHHKFLRSHDGNDDDAKPHPAARGPNALPQSSRLHLSVHSAVTYTTAPPLMMPVRQLIGMIQWDIQT